MLTGAANLVQLQSSRCILSSRPPTLTLFPPPYPSSYHSFLTVGRTSQIWCKRGILPKHKGVRNTGGVRCSSSNDSVEDSSPQEKVPFGYSRKDVLLIGIGVTVFGVGLKSGLEYVGVDPLQAGNVVQLIVVLGMTVAWISTYMFRVASKDMTYAQQLRDYESKVMEKRLEGLTEAELQVLLEQVEEEKTQKRSVTNSE